MGQDQSTAILEDACQNLDADTLQTLVHHGYNFNEPISKKEQKTTCLHICVLRNSLRSDRKRQRCLTMLLRAGANPCLQDSIGNTPLMMAASNNFSSSVRTLISYGSDVHLRNNYGQTALYLAVEHGYLDCMNILFLAGSDVNVQCVKRGSTLLHLSLLPGSTFIIPETLQLLLDCGADVNLIDNFGSRPIHRALEVKHQKAVMFFLVQNANIESPSLTESYILDCIHDLGLTKFMDECGYVTRRSFQPDDGFKTASTLKSCCRKSIRRFVGSNPRIKIQTLPLPHILLKYLLLGEYKM